jgi:fructose-1,6-bisphosphatase
MGHLNDTIINDLLVPVLLLLLKLLNDRLHVVGDVLSKGSRHLRSIRRHFEDIDIHP